ncbi:hypothetical protein [Halomicrobium urmianum]|uniref:hypothetical protein n=1 Tax=Halomicrobium urmianum TaxID=1586233 RepID=UPI001CDA2A66|nr:hypothetical protein [Halomicrobium urmianum]
MERERPRSTVRASAASVAGLLAAGGAVAVLPARSALAGGNPRYCAGGPGSSGAITLGLVALVVRWLTARLLLRQR